MGSLFPVEPCQAGSSERRSHQRGTRPDSPTTPVPSAPRLAGPPSSEGVHASGGRGGGAPVALSSRMLASTRGHPVVPSFQRRKASSSLDQGNTWGEGGAAQAGSAWGRRCARQRNQCGGCWPLGAAGPCGGPCRAQCTTGPPPPCSPGRWCRPRRRSCCRASAQRSCGETDAKGEGWLSTGWLKGWKPAPPARHCLACLL